MAGRNLTPISGRLIAACFATWLIALSHGSLALASANVPPSCDEESNNVLEIPASELLASNVSNELDDKNAALKISVSGEDRDDSARFLTPRAKSTLRQVFERNPAPAAAPRPDDEAAEDPDKPPMIKARVPGVSDVELERYKRHMYRRDI